jgi:hypothetical protein
MTHTRGTIEMSTTHRFGGMVVTMAVTLMAVCLAGCGKPEKGSQTSSTYPSMPDDQLYGYVKAKFEASPSEGVELMQSYLTAYPKGKHMGEATALLETARERETRARASATRARMSGLGLAIDIYEVAIGKYPPALSSLLKTDGSPNWKGPYLEDENLLVDAWGTPFAYQVKDSDYTIVSAGPDRIAGTPDDIQPIGNR